MKLKEVLKDYKNRQVKLGSKTAFVYCEIVNDNIINNLLFLSDKELENLHCLKTACELHLDRFELFWSIKKQNKIDNFIKDKKKICKHKNKKFKLSDYIDEIEKLKELIEDDKLKEFNSTQRKLNLYNKRIKEFTPFTEREVIDSYDSIYDEGTIIIKFAGDEEGEFWTRNEFNRLWGELVDKE